MEQFLIANMAPIMFGTLVVFLLSGFPVAFALAASALAACKGNASAAAATPQKGAGSTTDASGGSMAAHPTPVAAAAAAEEMDRMHEAGIKAFPAKTAGKGNQVLAPRECASGSRDPTRACGEAPPRACPPSGSSPSRHTPTLP